MITLHHLENSRSHRILWLLEELELPYELKRYARDGRSLRAPAALAAVHPLGKSPVITDDGTVIAESGAIVDYLINRYGQGRLLPTAGSAAHRQYQYWLHYAEGSLMPLLLMQLVFARMVAGSPALLRPLTRRIASGVKVNYLAPQLRLHLGVIESALAQTGWLAGDALSGADIQMSYPLTLAHQHPDPDADTGYPRIDAYLARLAARPAWQRAVAQGGALVALI